MLTLAVVLLAAPASALDYKGAEAQIRQARAQSNAAIARHDVAGMRAELTPDYTVLPGTHGLPYRLDTFDRRMTAAFADPTFVTYVRTPTGVSVAESGKRAAEIGSWVGVWRKPDGEMRVSGTYQAMWIPTVAGWRMVNESFVTLKCRGSAECAQVD